MATPEQIFEDLAQRFKLDAPFKEQILKLGVTSLSEFRYYFQDDSELLSSFFTPVESSLTKGCRGRASVRPGRPCVKQ